MLTQMLGSFAEFERAMVRERTRAGLKTAAARGRKGGRQPKLTPECVHRCVSGHTKVWKSVLPTLLKYGKTASIRLR
jgi:DNA invertase Pin-like site-specific DNA recombinase